MTLYETVMEKHIEVCERVPGPSELMAEFRANDEVSMTTLCIKYKVSDSFIRRRLVLAGITQEAIEARGKYTARVNRAKTLKLMEAAGRQTVFTGIRNNKNMDAVRCRRCEILVYQSAETPHQDGINNLCLNESGVVLCPECLKSKGEKPGSGRKGYRINKQNEL
jgi:hypothetical protein